MSKNPDKIGPSRPAIANKRTTFVAQTYNAVVHEPGETEGDEEIGDQRMTTGQAAKAKGGCAGAVVDALISPEGISPFIGRRAMFEFDDASSFVMRTQRNAKIVTRIAIPKRLTIDSPRGVVE